MSDIKTKAQAINPNAEGRNLSKLVSSTGNIYESLAIIARRANQLQRDIKEELTEKLSEFVETGETIEEITENKEQIEISRSYERLPNPAIIATTEFLNGELVGEYKQSDREVGDF